MVVAAVISGTAVVAGGSVLVSWTAVVAGGKMFSSVTPCWTSAEVAGTDVVVAVAAPFAVSESVVET